MARVDGISPARRDGSARTECGIRSLDCITSMFYHLKVCIVFHGIEVQHVLSVRSEFGSCDGAHSFVLVLLVQVMFPESFEMFIDA